MAKIRIHEVSIEIPDGYAPVFEYPEIDKLFLKLPLYVVAEDYNRAKNWFQSKFPGISTKYGMRYVDDGNRLRGLSKVNVVLLDGWGRNLKWDEIYVILQSIPTDRMDIYYEQDFEKEP